MSYKISFVVFIIAIIIGFLLYNSQIQSKCDNYYDQDCADRFFSSNYFEARTKFLEISNLIPSANIYSLPVYKTKSNQQLYIDITILNEHSSSNHLITHSSGTHGAEGYAGSAIQLSILEFINNYTLHNIKGIKSNLLNPNSMLEYIGTDTIINDKKPIIILIHSINPYGFMKGIRCNENNVDLNRNLKTTKEWNTFDTMHPNKYHYEDLNTFFNPVFSFTRFMSKTQSIFGQHFASILTTIYYYYSYQISFYLAAIYHILFKFGIDVKTPAIALVVGTKNKYGLGYVGTPYIREESHLQLEHFIHMLFDKHIDWKTQINKLSFIDVHTGLGDYGKDTLLVSTNEEKNKLLEYKMRKTLNTNNVMNVREFIDGVYEDVTGSNLDYINLIVRKLGKTRDEFDIVGVAQEFGTCLFKTSLLQSLRFSNAMYWEYINATKLNVSSAVLYELEGIVKKARDIEKRTFYVEEVEWKKDVVKRGFVLFAALFKR